MPFMRRTAAKLLITCLEKRGVKYIFGVPGEENLAILEAIRQSKIKFITTRHEQSAVFMAATIGRLTGKAGVALSTLGPGATNLVTGVAYAQLGGMPLLVITGQKPIRANKQGKFQIVDVVRMFEPITKSSQTIISADSVPSLVHEALNLAEAERPGAVHLELPEDIAEETSALEPIISEKVRRPGPDPKAITKAVKLIEKAKNPLILIASGANRKLIRKQLSHFVEKTQIPFVTTQMGKGVLDERSPLYLGTTALSSGDFVHQALAKSDLIISLGHDTTEKPPIVLTSAKHQVLHINFFPADVNPVYVPTLEIVGDISHTLWALAENIKPKKSWDFSYFYRTKKSWQKNLEAGAKNSTFPLAPERIVADIREVLPEDGILSLDNGMYKIWVARNFPAYEQQSVLLDNALATMGAGLPAGIATKMVNPHRKVLVVTGDGGFMMTLAELETAKRLKLDLTILILTDQSYGMIKWKQHSQRLPSFGLDFTNPDFVKLAESFGGKGYRLKKVTELKPTLEQCLKNKGLHIIDCPINYNHKDSPLGKI